MISSVVRFWFVLKFSTCDLQIKDAIIELSPLSFFGYLCEETQYLFSSLSLAPPPPPPPPPLPSLSVILSVSLFLVSPQQLPPP